MRKFKMEQSLPCQRVSQTLLSWLLAALLMALSGALAADELTEDLLKNRIKTIQKSGNSAEIDATLPIYEETLTWLREAEAQNQSAAGYVNTLESSPKRQAEIREHLDTLDENAGTITSTQLEDLSWKELEKKANDIGAQLTETINNRDSLTRRIASETANNNSIQGRLLEIDQRESELPAIIIVVDPKAQPSQFEASQWLIAAEQQSLNAERRALNARLASQPARTALRRVELEEATVMIGFLQNDLATLEAAMEEKDPFDTIKALAKLSEDTPGYALVKSIVDINDVLAERRTTLLANLNSKLAHRDELQSNLVKLNGQFSAVRMIVESASESTSFGQILMTYWRTVDQFRPSQSYFNIGREVGDQVIKRTEYEKQFAELASATTYVNLLRAQQPDGNSIEDATLEIATEQTLVNRNRLKELITLESRMVDVLGEIALTQEQLKSQVKAYRSFLASHVLWEPSHSPLGKNFLKQLLVDIKQTAVQVRSIPFVWLDSIAVLGLFIGLLLFWLRQRLAKGRHAVNQKIGRPRSDSVQHTFLALLLTVLQAAALPLLIVALAHSLRSSEDTLALSLSNALVVAAHALWLILFWRVACDQHGIARVHFGWSPARCDQIFAMTKWALFRLWPLIILTSALVNLENDSLNAVLSRLVYAGTNFVLGYKLVRILSRNFIQTGKTPVVQKFWIGLVILLTLGQVLMVLAGYLLPAQMIFHSLVYSLSVVTVLTFTYFILLRWLLVTRRQLRFQQLVASQKDPEQSDNEAALSYAADLSKLSKTTTELLKTGARIFGAIWLFYVWSPLLPALEGLQRISLWTVSETVGDTQVVTDITLATLLMVLVIGAATLYAARKLPSLLELLLRSYSAMVPGSRYAAVTILNYIIIGSGVIFLLATLGLRWEKLQWLVAALSLGIGFGLQEIVANFISGLIILFERPIRVGDIVTVGESSGQVTRIQIRATTIRDWDRKELLVPNKEFVTGRLLNWTLSDSINRIIITVGIAYGSDVEKAIKTLYNVMAGHEEVLKDPEPSVLFDEFGGSSLTLTARCFIGGIEERIRVTSELHQRVNAAFRAEGIVIAFPQQDVHFDSSSPIRVSIEKPGDD